MSKAKKPSQGHWFRMYVSILDNPKLARLSEAQCWNWAKLLAIAVVYGGVIPDEMAAVSYRLRKPEAKVRELIQVFISAGLLERCDGGFIPHDWESMQFDSDVSTNRVRAFRERARNVSRNTDETFPKRPHSTETENIEVPLAKANGRHAAAETVSPPPKPAKPDDPWKAVYDRGKQVIGRSAGGQITLLRKLYDDKPHKVLAAIEDAAEKRNPEQWIAQVLWNARDDGRLSGEYIGGVPP